MLTIGTATYDDYDGVYFTLAALRMYHPDVIKSVKLIVIDNNPKSDGAERLRQLCNRMSVRYEPFGEIAGTAPAKNRLFDVAETEWVCCVDSHVLLAPNAVESLLKYASENPDSADLISGPLLYDQLHISTHMADEWRGGMWGTWATDERGKGETPFEIPAMGMGCFAMRRVTWPGFNRNFREFGGEEWYIHEKVRQRGGRCICLPQLKWQHRFGDPAGGRKSPLGLWGKVRNYMIGLNELGIDFSRLRSHFVEGLNTDGTTSRDNRMQQHHFDQLTHNPTMWPIRFE